jgi:hypothetical protein
VIAMSATKIIIGNITELVRYNDEYSLLDVLIITAAAETIFLKYKTE